MFTRISLLLLLLLFLFSPPSSRAEYVLPYPSTMPGSKLYSLHELWGTIQSIWYFGDFAKIQYYQNRSDKYLVEAKVLFEYKQYLLATRALYLSNDAYSQLLIHLSQAERNRKDVTEKRKILYELSQKHIEELKKITTFTPVSYLWKPERSEQVALFIHKDLHDAIVLRKRAL